MRRQKFFLILMLPILLSLCQTTQKTSVRRPTWGDSAATIALLEKERLGQEPEIIKPNQSFVELVYEDKLMNARCKLIYQLQNDHLARFYYSCSNPDWDEAEVKMRILHSFTKLYGEPTTRLFDKNEYDVYKSADGLIYFRIERIQQTRDMWRTFVAVLINTPVPL